MGGASRHAGAKPMFFMFSNRLGCLKSLLISAALTILLLIILGVVQIPGW